MITLIFPELLNLKNVLTWVPESSCFRTPFGSNRVKGSQTLLKSARQHFYANFHSCQAKWEMYHTFWWDMKCEDRLITRWRLITCFSVSIDRNSRNKFQRNYLQYQKHFLELFRSYWIQKMCLLECPKAPVSEHPFVVNLLKVLKHSWSLHKSTFMLTFHSCQTKWEMYHAFRLDLKRDDRLITRWRPITCILLVKDTNPSSKFQPNYVQNHKYFLQFLLHFWNLNKISSIFFKK